MSSIFGKKPVPASVTTEILARASKKGIEWSAKRFPWIEVTSLCDKCSDDYTVLSSAKKATNYYEGSDSLRPKPVVTEVKVIKQGELGTTRRAIINLTAYTDQQLRDLQNCYFIPGMGCRVEWGWSLDATSLKPPPATLGNRSLTDAQAICAMNTKAATSTHYSGIQGQISNFSYNLTADNTWECSIEVIAASEGLGGSKVNDYSCDCGREYTNEENEDTKKVVDKKSGLYTFFKDIYDNYFIAFAKYYPGITAASQGGSLFAGQFNLNAPQKSETGKEETSFWEDITPNWLNTPDATDAFISWGTLEAAINSMSLPSADGQYTMGSLSSGNMELTYHPSLESTDPRICIVPGTTYASTIAKPLGSDAPSAIEGNRVILSKILLNCNMLMAELAAVEDGNGTIKTYLTNVLRKVNDACGSLWEFEVVSGTEDCLNPSRYPKLQIVDTKVYEAATAFELPALAIGNDKSVLRDMKLEMKMTDSMKTQALHSNGVPQSSTTDSGGNCGQAGFKGFGLAVAGTFNNLSIKKASTPPKCLCEGAAPNEKKPSISELFENLGDGVSDTTASACRSAIMEAYGKSVKAGDDEHCKGMIMPFDFNFTLDGIGGFAFGQIVSSDRIPERLREALDWQVTSVEHSITPNDWTTTVSSVCRYK
jgi:hypothetical protein